MAKARWIKIKVSDIPDKRIGTHNFTKHILHWPYCGQCGLILLHNWISFKVSKKSCVY